MNSGRRSARLGAGSRGWADMVRRRSFEEGSGVAYIAKGAVGRGR